MNNIIGTVLICLSTLFILIGCVGVVRFPDFYTRLQAGVKCIVGGTCAMILGTMLIVGWGGIALKCCICLILMLLASPAAAQALARSAQIFGAKMWDRSVANKFEEDTLPATDRKAQE